MSPLEQCVAALKAIREEGVTSLRAVYLIDEAILAAESAPTEEEIVALASINAIRRLAAEIREGAKALPLERLTLGEMADCIEAGIIEGIRRHAHGRPS